VLLFLFLYSTTLLSFIVRSLADSHFLGGLSHFLSLSFEFIIRNNSNKRKGCLPLSVASAAAILKNAGGSLVIWPDKTDTITPLAADMPPATHKTHTTRTRNILIFVYVFSLNRQSLRCSYFPKCHYAACEYKDGGLSCAKLPPASLFT
jgi:hypothetical protein